MVRPEAIITIRIETEALGSINGPIVSTISTASVILPLHIPYLYNLLTAALKTRRDQDESDEGGHGSKQ